MDSMEIALSQFKKVKIGDWPLIAEYLKASDYQESNHNIVNLMMWKHRYPIWMHEGDQWLLILGIHDGEWFLYMPLCKSGGCFKKALRYGESVFENQNVPYVLSCYTEEVKNAFLEFDPDFAAEEVRDGFDYIYPFEQLATFQGKKMQKKRNHLNAFLKDYEGRWEYETLTETQIPEVIAYLEEWHRCMGDDAFLNDEVAGVKYLLEHWGILPAKGGLIRVDGAVRGFTIGSQLNHNTIQVNVEKADGSIRGLYPALTKEFLQHEFEAVEWINREDDVGHENIRQAKLALQPAYLLKKYRLKRTGR